MPVQAYSTFQDGSTETRTERKPCGLKRYGERAYEGKYSRGEG